MVTYRWNNEIQRAVVEEWTEGCQKARGLQDLRNLRKQLAEKYGLNMSIVHGMVELGATEGMVQRSYPYGKKYDSINVFELVGNLKERVEDLERKFRFLLDGVQNILEDGETMAVHLSHLRKMGKWMKKRDSLDVEGIRSTPFNENKGPPLLEAEATEPQTDRGKEMEILRRRIDKARARLDSDGTKVPTSRLLFSGIKEK